MRRDIVELIKKFPVLDKQYDMHVLQKVSDEAAEMGPPGIEKNLEKLGDYETRLVASFMGMNQAIRNDNYTQAAELAGIVFQMMVALDLFEDAQTFATNLCSPDTGYARAALALIYACGPMIQIESYRGNADKLKKINEMRALLL